MSQDSLPFPDRQQAVLAGRCRSQANRKSMAWQSGAHSRCVLRPIAPTQNVMNRACEVSGRDPRSAGRGMNTTLYRLER